MQPVIDIEKVKQGNHAAFKVFFERLYPKLMALACRFVGDEDAEDIVQNVFAVYWEKKETVSAENILSFMYKWVQNDCLNYLKHRMVIEEYEAHVRLANERIEYMENITDANDVFKQLVKKDLLDAVEVSVSKLSPRYAEAFRLCYFKGMSHKEIAKEMNISQRTVEGHIRQAILFLRKDLRELLTLFFIFFSF